VHTALVGSALPEFARAGPDDGVTWGERLAPLLSAAQATLSQNAERRRLRAYGFRPAVEEGVLKREWQGVEVRVSHESLRAIDPARGELRVSGEGEITFRGDEITDQPDALVVADALVALISDYERWVEAREGRASRLRRAHAAQSDRRPVNALAETRRLQRLLGSAWGRPPSRRR
jgi:hypothetical protein